MGNLEDAVARFEAAQDIAKDHAIIRGQITILLAKALWEIRSDKFKDSAKEQLLDWYVFENLLSHLNKYSSLFQYQS